MLEFIVFVISIGASPECVDMSTQEMIMIGTTADGEPQFKMVADSWSVPYWVKQVGIWYYQGIGLISDRDIQNLCEYLINHNIAVKTE